MKASDYYEKYHEEFAENPDIAIQNLRTEMIDEAERIKEVRHVKTPEGAERVIREQVNKWNAIVRIFETNGGSPIKRNDLIPDSGGDGNA